MEKNEILNIIDENKITSSYVLATFYNKVCLGYYENKDIHFTKEPDYKLCTSIRLFNEDLELRIENINDKIYSKVVKDEDYQYCLKDEFMFLSGNKIIKQDDRFTTIKQVNGEIDVPLILSDEQVKQGIRLIVRNYLEVDENKQVVLTESRLVGITDKEN